MNDHEALKELIKEWRDLEIKKMMEDISLTGRTGERDWIAAVAAVAVAAAYTKVFTHLLGLSVEASES